jgi:hypothetical protein
MVLPEAGDHAHPMTHMTSGLTDHAEHITLGHRVT